VVAEELLAAGAPVAAHWVADRQSGPALLRFGTEEQKRAFLPRIAHGECFFAIGMSEPDAGSDLASVRTRGNRVDSGWVLNGTKIWTSGAHEAHAMIVLARTAPPAGDRHAGLTQFIVELPAPHVHIRPIRLLTGEHHFNEVVFDDAFVPDARVLGVPGAGWEQVTSELAMERSGPERILSTFPLLAAAVDHLARAGDGADTARLGGLVVRLWALRQLSLAVAGRLEAGAASAAEAAMVKDLGTRFEGAVTETVRLLTRVEPDLSSAHQLAQMLAQAVLHGPGFTPAGRDERDPARRGCQAAGRAMSEVIDALVAAVSAACARLSGDEAVTACADGGWNAKLWLALDQIGVTAVSVPEEYGGAGGDVRTAAAVLEVLGRYSASVPLAETALLAGWMLAAWGRKCRQGR
jgi:acyl-CoA dehydrogenase